MKKLLITIYFVLMFMILFGFTSLIFYPDMGLSVIKILLLISVLFYIIFKSSKYEFKITRNVAVLSMVYCFFMAMFF